MNYSEARALMSRARHPENGKPLQSNIRLYQRGDDYAIRHYSTDTVTIHKDGTYTLRTGGWETRQTRDGIETYAPIPSWNRILKVDGSYWLRTRPKDSDPEPKVEQRQIPNPFWARSPGPEPVKGTFGCLAGTRYARTDVVKKHVWLDGYAASELNPTDKVDFDYNRAPNRARSVTAYLKATLDERWVNVWRVETTVIDYVEDYKHWDHTRLEKECPHCTAFRRLHSEWESANRKWQSFIKHMDEHGGYAGWLEASRADLRRLKAENKAWAEWSERNRIPLNYARIGRDGYPLQKNVHAYFKSLRDNERARRRKEREAEARARHERHMARLKSGYHQRRQARRPRFERIAEEITKNLVETRNMVIAQGGTSDDRTD